MPTALSTVTASVASPTALSTGTASVASLTAALAALTAVAADAAAIPDADTTARPDDWGSAMPGRERPELAPGMDSRSPHHRHSCLWRSLLPHLDEGGVRSAVRRPMRAVAHN
mmetsp:Transcript_23185/g.78235  ORF Transcript_23185/g.78235 Transcript_23185/m.78235 type:complete len:113 (+) Transcript_23185:1156-1494(+)